MIFRKYLLFLFVVLFVYCLHAQNGQQVFSLEEAQQYAFEHAYDIKSESYDVQAAKKKAWEIIASGLPQLNVSANYNDHLDIATQLIPDFITPIIYDVNEDKFGLTPIVPRPTSEFFPAKFGQQYSSNYTFSLSQLIFDGTYIVGVQAVKVYLQLSENKKEKVEIEIKDIVTSAYYNVLVAEENYKILGQTLQNNQKLLKEVKAFYENGFREETDVLQMQLLTNSSENQLSDAKRLIETSRLLLKFSMGMDIENTIVLTDSIEKFIDNALKTQHYSGTMSSIIEHIDYRILETQLRTQKLLLKSERSKYLPKISAFYNYSKDAFSNEWNVFENEWYKSSMIGIQFSMPIFRSGLQRAKVAQEKFAFKKTENQLIQIKQNLKRERIEAYNNLLNAQEKFKNDKIGLNLAKIIYDRTIVKFNEGISNSTELSQNERQYLISLGIYFDSILRLINTKKAYLKSIAKL